MTFNEKMTIDIPSQAEQDMPVEYCVAWGSMHIKVDTPETGERWIRMGLPEEMWDAQSQIEQRMNVLEKTIEALGNWKHQLYLWNLDRVQHKAKTEEGQVSISYVDRSTTLHL
jgi:hypothetical protein